MIKYMPQTEEEIWQAQEAYRREQEQKRLQKPVLEPHPEEDAMSQQDA